MSCVKSVNAEFANRLLNGTCAFKMNYINTLGAVHYNMSVEYGKS